MRLVFLLSLLLCSIYGSFSELSSEQELQADEYAGSERSSGRNLRAASAPGAAAYQLNYKHPDASPTELAVRDLQRLLDPARNGNRNAARNGAGSAAAASSRSAGGASAHHPLRHRLEKLTAMVARRAQVVDAHPPPSKAHPPPPLRQSPSPGSPQKEPPPPSFPHKEPPPPLRQSPSPGSPQKEPPPPSSPHKEPPPPLRQSPSPGSPQKEPPPPSSPHKERPPPSSPQKNHPPPKPNHSPPPPKGGPPSYPLGGGFYTIGLYYISVLVGTPAKAYSVDIDTGSDIMWLFCSDCKSCPTEGPGGGRLLRFDWRASNSTLVNCDVKKSPSSLCRDVQRESKRFEGCVFPDSRGCYYSALYGDSYTQGRLVQGDVSVRVASGALLKVSAQFGCTFDYLAASSMPVSGLLGLGRSRVSLPSQMKAQGGLPAVFGHCLGGNEGGYFFFGKELASTAGLTWAPLAGSASQGFYNLVASSVRVNGTLLKLEAPATLAYPGGEFVIDSGSTGAYFQTALFNAFLEQLMSKPLTAKGRFREAVGADGTTVTYVFDGMAPGVTTLVRGTSDSRFCWSTPGVIISDVGQVDAFFPELKLQFGPKSALRLRAPGYLALSDPIFEDAGQVCLGIEDGGDMSLLGDQVLRNFLVVYDNESSRLGWVKKDCSKGPPP